MRIVVLGALYLVVIASLLYAATATYMLLSFWDVKVELGTAMLSLAKIGTTIVFGAGVPYCLIDRIRRG